MFVNKKCSNCYCNFKCGCIINNSAIFENFGVLMFIPAYLTFRLANMGLLNCCFFWSESKKGKVTFEK